MVGDIFRTGLLELADDDTGFGCTSGTVSPEVLFLDWWFEWAQQIPRYSIMTVLLIKTTSVPIHHSLSIIDGCAPQLDDDGDGVSNDLDQLDTLSHRRGYELPQGHNQMMTATALPNDLLKTGRLVVSMSTAMADAPSQLDVDGDGVTNDLDQCPDSPRIPLMKKVVWTAWHYTRSCTSYDNTMDASDY